MRVSLQHRYPYLRVWTLLFSGVGILLCAQSSRVVPALVIERAGCDLDWLTNAIDHAIRFNVQSLVTRI